MRLINSQIRGYGLALLTVAIALSLLLALHHAIDVTSSPFLLFFIPVIVSALYGGFKPGLLATVLTALGIAYLFPSPNYSSAISLDKNIINSLFLLSGALLSSLIAQVEAVKQRSYTEQQIQQKNQQTIDILENITDAFIYLDREWRITYANQEVVKINQQKREEIIGKTHWEQWPWSVGTVVEKQYRRAMTEQVPVHFEVLYEPLNMWLEIHAYPSPNGLSIYYRDISDRHRYEETLEQQTAAIWQQQQWLEAVLNLMPTPLLFIEPGTARVKFANKAADELAGGKFPKDKPAEEYHTIYYCTDNQGNRIPNEQMPGVRVARGERLAGFEINWHTPEGIRSLLIDADTLPQMHARPATCVLVFQDVTKLKQAEAAWGQSEARFQRLVKSNIIGVVIGTFAGEILEANDAFLNLVGYTRSEMQAGKLRWIDITPPEYLNLDIQGQQQMLSSGIGLPYEKEYIRKDGSRVPILIGGALLEGYQDRAVAFAIDLTERKQMENVLREQAEELAKNSRVKDEFLAVISHELRTPLNSILGWAQMLRSRNLSLEIQTKALETIERNAKNQKQLIEDLLDVSRIITGKLRLKPRSLELVPVIEKAIDSVRSTAEAREISLISHLESDLTCSFAATSNLSLNSPWCVLGDAERLQQVFWNLLSNAIKFTPKGGRVEIKLSMVIGNGSSVIGDRNYQLPITNYQLPITNYVQITVSDTGIGIKPDFLPYVFDRFTQADTSTTRSYQGLGLGLAIARHLVEFHGGTIHVESLGEGLGATFTVKLPLICTTIDNC